MGTLVKFGCFNISRNQLGTLKLAMSTGVALTILSFPKSSAPAKTTPVASYDDNAKEAFDNVIPGTGVQSFIPAVMRTPFELNVAPMLKVVPSKFELPDTPAVTPPAFV